MQGWEIVVIVSAIIAAASAAAVATLEWLARNRHAAEALGLDANKLAVLQGIAEIAAEAIEQLSKTGEVARSERLATAIRIAEDALNKLGFPLNVDEDLIADLIEAAVYRMQK